MPRANWSRQFHAPLYPSDGPPIVTLSDARAYMLALPQSASQQNQWQHAAQQLLAASQGKAFIASARHAMHNALVISVRLDFSRK